LARIKCLRNGQTSLAHCNGELSMKILVDYIGHADLAYSMYALFEKRLGFEIYRPLGGPEWEGEGVHTSTLPDVAGDQVEIDGLQCIPMPTHGYTQKCVTLEQFKDMHFDALLTTSWMNEEPFNKLVKKYKPNAKLIRQIANIHEVPKVCKNILLSTCEPMKPGINWIKYLPEHLDKYNYVPSVSSNLSIKSFFNYMKNYKVEEEMWRKYEAALPEFEFKMHGGDGEHGSIPQEELEVVMRDATLIWHVKPHGGCGYTARQALACGKPLIVRKDYCRMHRTLAMNYLVDGANCIDISPSFRSFEDSVKLIREWSNPETYLERTKQVIAETMKHNNFEEEAIKIKEWLTRLI